jgi:hypothetical protein
MFGLFAGQAEVSPDLMVFCLDHPGFTPLAPSLRERLSLIRGVYDGYAVGDDVTLVEPEDGRVVRSFLALHPSNARAQTHSSAR